MNEKKLRILLAEGYPGETTAALRALYPDAQANLELTNVSSVSTLIATLEVVDPEVLFLDLSLAHPDPLDEVRRVHRAAPSVPLIVLAENGNKDCAAKSLTQGAQDYLLKGFIDPPTLERVLRVALEHNTLDGLADLLRDAQTGLYTRDGFLTLGDHAMEMAKSKESTLVLLCMRIENLEELRTEFGPSAAETSLSEVANLLKSSFRRSDILARLGDSQFAALAVDAAEPSAPVLRQRLQKRITMLNRDIGPWGPLQIRMSARFWVAKKAITFSEFLDEVEGELRSATVLLATDVEKRDRIAQP